MASDNSKHPHSRAGTRFLSPKFGMPPEEATENQDDPDTWADEEVENFVAQLLGQANNQTESEHQEEARVQAVHEGRDSLIRQLGMARDLEQLGFVTKRFHALISKGEILAANMTHKQSAMLGALNLANDKYNVALKIARDKLESELAKKEDEQQERDERNRKPSHPAYVPNPDKKCPQCGGLLGFGCRLCYTCASGFGPKSDKCPNCGGVNGYDGGLCFSCASGNGPPIKVRLDRCPKCGGMNGLPGSLCFSCANW